MPKIEREQLLKELESVTPGLSVREIIEQSSCFVFRKGKVCTFNDEIACWMESALTITGAVQANTLLNLLRKLPEDTIDISIDHDKLVVKGKRRRARVILESEVTLPIDSIRQPKSWKTLPADFLEGLSLVQDCVGKDETNFVLTCVHIHPDKLEASDNDRVAKFKTKTDLDKPTLIRKDSIKHIVSLGMTEFGETKNWMHFRNVNGLVISCRRYSEDFPDTDPAFKIKGKKMSLPKGLEGAAERASVFTTDNAEDDDILISLSTGKATIVGTGANGDFREVKKVEYAGPELTFMISPNQLIALTKKHNDAIVSQEKLKCKSGKFEFVAALGVVGEGDEDEQETEE